MYISEIIDIEVHKLKQLDIVLNANKMLDDYHTGIREVDDIKTAEEVFLEKEQAVYTPDWTEDDMQKALKEKRVKIYSSYPIKEGVFITPSAMEAKNYAGGGYIYSKNVPLSYIAWIDSIEGQYAPVKKEG